MSSSKTNLRSSFSFPNLLLSCLNFTLLVLSAASAAPTLLLRRPPTSTGAALLMVSATSLIAALAGLYSQLTHMCFVTHLSLLLAALAGQILAVLALFAKESSTLAALASPREPREARLLARLECGALMAMALVQAAVLVLSCAVQSCWVREFEGMEEKKRTRRSGARVQEESLAHAPAKPKAVGAEAEMKSKCGNVQWVKTDFEG